MIRVLRMIAGNLAAGPASLRLPETVPAPDGFRGRVELDTSRCLGCGMCAYVCVSEAIRLDPRDDGCTWRYDPGRCAYCARCVERCPANALSMTAAPLAPYGRPGQLESAHEVTFPPCPECGAPTRPAPEVLMHKAFEHLEEHTLMMAQRCERCRRRWTQRKLVPVPEGPAQEHES